MQVRLGHVVKPQQTSCSRKTGNFQSSTKRKGSSPRRLEALVNPREPVLELQNTEFCCVAHLCGKQKPTACGSSFENVAVLWMASFWRVPFLERGRLRGEPLSLLLSLAIPDRCFLQHAIVLGRLIEGLCNLESGFVLTIAAKKRTVRCAVLVLVLGGSGGSGGMFCLRLWKTSFRYNLGCNSTKHNGACHMLDFYE